MPDGPSESPGTRAEPKRILPDDQQPEDRQTTSRREIPRPVVKADLLPAASTVSLVALLGLPLGWVWSQLAPPKQSSLTPDGRLASVLVESYHEFDALGIFMMLSCAFGVISAVLLWMMRHRRGPVFLIAGVLGSAVAAWLGMSLGPAFAESLYPMPNSPPGNGLITVAPALKTHWAVLMQPLAFVLVYGLAASWNGLDDLGRRRVR